MWPLSFSGFRFCKRCINAVVPNDLISHMVAEELKIIVAELIMSENKTFFFSRRGGAVESSASLFSRSP